MKNKNRVIFTSLITVVLASATAYAADGTWNSDANGNWNSATNPPWNGGTIADGSGFTAFFNAVNLTADRTVTLGANRTIGNLNFGDTNTATAGSWIVSGNTLTLAGTTPTVTVGALGTGKIVTINSILAGTSGFTKSGAGTLSLTANSSSTLSGPISVTGGTLDLLGGVGSSGSIVNTNTNFSLSGAGTTLSFRPAATTTYTGNITTSGGQGVILIDSSFTPIPTLAFSGNLGTSTSYIRKFTTNSNGNLTLSGTNFIGDGDLFGSGRSDILVTGGVTTTRANIFYLSQGSSLATANLSISNNAQFIVAANTTIRIGAGGDMAGNGPNGERDSGPTALNISNTALFDTGTTTGLFQLGNNKPTMTITASGTINLNGGTLATNRVITGGTKGASIFNFNGGVYKANGTAATISLDATNGRINLRDGGAKVDTNGFNITFGQALTHSNVGGDLATDGGLTKSGLGTLTLTTTNTYTGNTTIKGGTLALTGTGTLGSGSSIIVGDAGSSGAVLDVTGITGGTYTVGSTQTLSGIGTVTAAGKKVIVNGTLAPGNSAGLLNVTTVNAADGLAFGSTGALSIEMTKGVTPTAGTNYDQLGLTGGMTISTGADLNLLALGSGSWTLDDIYFLVNNDSTDAITGTFDGFAEGATITFDSQQFKATYLANFGSNSFTGGNDFALQVIPEPNVAALLGGLGTLLLLRRRRNR